MYNCTKNYIDGERVDSTAGSVGDIINPATGQLLLLSMMALMVRTTNTF